MILISLEEIKMKAINKVLQNLQAAAAKMETKVNQSETKYMVTNPQGMLPTHLLLKEHAFERVEEFIQLGSLITQDNDIKNQMQEEAQQLTNAGVTDEKQIIVSHN